MLNQGFKTINENEWILFWGSDDWASSSNIFENIAKEINSYQDEIDLVVCKGDILITNQKNYQEFQIF